jgi:hypothetical protein
MDFFLESPGGWMTQMMREALLWPTITKNDSSRYVKRKEGTPSTMKSMLEKGKMHDRREVLFKLSPISS